jgi:Ca-activated chloride channel family protein
MAVTRDSPSSIATRSETIVVIEAPVVAPGTPVSVVPAGLPVPRVGAATARTGGASFNDAPLISTGSYADTLSTGETRYYRVHLDWGQRFSYQISVGKLAGLGHGSGFVRTAVATPMREEVALSSSSNSARAFGGPVSIAVSGSTLVPVEYGNRDSDLSGVRAYRLAGDYYLSLGLSYPIDALPYRTPVVVSVAVVGTPTAGPDYLPLPASAAAPTSSVSAVSSPASSGPASSGPALSPVVSPTGVASAPSAAKSDSIGWLWGVGAALVVVGAVAVAMVWRRRSRPSG